MRLVSNEIQTVTDEERERRAAVLSAAQASVFLSGCEISTEEKVHAQLYANGEISLEQFIRGGRPPAISSSPPVGRVEGFDDRLD